MENWGRSSIIDHNGIISKLKVEKDLSEYK